MDKMVWKLVVAGCGVGAEWATRRALVGAWRRTRDADPPSNPESPHTGWGEALVWAALIGMLTGIARLVVTRGAAAAWRNATGLLPPGLEEVG